MQGPILSLSEFLKQWKKRYIHIHQSRLLYFKHKPSATTATTTATTTTNMNNKNQESDIIPASKEASEHTQQAPSDTVNLAGAAFLDYQEDVKIQGQTVLFGIIPRDTERKFIFAVPVTGSSSSSTKNRGSSLGRDGEAAAGMSPDNNDDSMPCSLQDARDIHAKWRIAFLNAGCIATPAQDATNKTNSAASSTTKRRNKRKKKRTKNKRRSSKAGTVSTTTASGAVDNASAESTDVTSSAMREHQPITDRDTSTSTSQLTQDGDDVAKTGDGRNMGESSSLTQDGQAAEDSAPVSTAATNDKGTKMQFSEGLSCVLCEKSFSVRRLRHHCRHCLESCCDTCSKHRLRLPEKGHKDRVRVCNICYGVIMTPAAPVASPPTVKGATATAAGGAVVIDKFFAGDSQDGDAAIFSSPLSSTKGTPPWEGAREGHASVSKFGDLSTERDAIMTPDGHRVAPSTLRSIDRWSQLKGYDSETESIDGSASRSQKRKKSKESHGREPDQRQRLMQDEASDSGATRYGSTEVASPLASSHGTPERHSPQSVLRHRTPSSING